MKVIEFTAPFGDQDKQVEIIPVSGGAGGMCHLYINSYYQGAFILRNNRWTLLPQRPLDPSKENPNGYTFMMDDIQILEDMLNSG